MMFRTHGQSDLRITQIGIVGVRSSQQANGIADGTDIRLDESEIEHALTRQAA